jgi:cellulose synthase/poly-beta-1,6-N-acetylglucosamine synthase-like glycosyltransferase
MNERTIQQRLGEQRLDEQRLDERRLAARRAAISPRYTAVPTPLRSRLIHGGALALWVLLFARAFGGGGLFAWSAGLIYILYDTVLLVFVFWQTLPLLRREPAQAARALPATSVIVAARNEAAVLPVTLAALLAQTSPADEIIIADDGSDDATPALLRERYGLEAPEPGELSAPGTVVPALRWLRLTHGGKALALNLALMKARSELVLTVDADTLLEPGALAAMQEVFADDAGLVAATGVLTPVCAPTLQGRLLQWFQTYEYVRNFLSRYAWMQQDGLLLISGAFGCYRRAPLLEVGGFDADCLVEDYELTHRLRDYAGRRGLAWHTAVVGGSHARTDAPATMAAFLRQRRRWFGGFLQTQLWYRHMVGNPAYGRLGTRMLVVKAIDTLQPVYGLTGAVLLLWWIVRGAPGIVLPVLGVIGAKIALDLGFYIWSLHLYRRWLGHNSGLYLVPAVLAALIEPFSFQLLRHSGAALGWVSFLTGTRSWGAQAPRLGVAGPAGTRALS